jgi:hypothetical protein
MADDHALPAAPFIVGVGRSGTTLLRLMLDAHSQLAIPGETHFLPEVAGLGEGPDASDAFLRIITGAPTWPNLATDAAALAATVEALEPFTVTEGIRAFYRLYAGRFGKSRWGDKTPPYRSQMPAIQAVVPEAHFIHIVRDGRDVALSYSGLWFGPSDEIEAQARFWVDQIRSTRRDATALAHYLEVRYEDLVMEPARTLRTICAWLGLPFEPRMLDYHLSASERLAETRQAYGPQGRITMEVTQFLAIHAYTAKPPDRNRIGRWRTEMPRADRQLFESIAGGLLQELGYEPG